jgi:hypothetical protein
MFEFIKIISKLQIYGKAFVSDQWYLAVFHFLKAAGIKAKAKATDTGWIFEIFF